MRVEKNQNKYVFDSGSVPVPNRFEPVPKFIFSLEPQPKKRFGSTEKWNHNHNHWFGFGLNRFPTVPEPDRGSTTAREALWIRTLLEELGFDARETPTEINVDNKGAIELGKHPKFHARAKHIRISYHEVRSYIADKEIAIVYCPSAENAADIFTKGLPRPAHDRMLDLIGMDCHLRGSVDSTV